MYFVTADKDGNFDLPAIPAGQYIVTGLGARASNGTEVKEGQPSIVNLDVGLPAAPATPPQPPRKHASRLLPPTAPQGAPPAVPDAPTPSP
jgi:hypothetical protein